MKKFKFSWSTFDIIITAHSLVFIEYLWNKINKKRKEILRDSSSFRFELIKLQIA